MSSKSMATLDVCTQQSSLKSDLKPNKQRLVKTLQLARCWLRAQQQKCGKERTVIMSSYATHSFR